MLPCDLCQGYTLDVEPLADSASASEQSMDGNGAYAGPSLLGSTYLAAQVRHGHTICCFSEQAVCLEPAADLASLSEHLRRSHAEAHIASLP